jgi:DNA-binding SARP family transcriptional activator
MPGLDILLFGPGRIRHGDAEAAESLAPGVRTLLGYLVLNRNRPHRREALANVFWNEVDESRARNRLSTALWRLRKALEPDGTSPGTFLTSLGRGEVQFNETPDLWVDIDCFEKASDILKDRPATDLSVDDIRDVEAALSAYTGDLLEGNDSPWLMVERERYAQLYLSAQARLLNWHLSVGELDQAIAAGHQILERDPLREEVHRALIRVYGESGRRAHAISQFKVCRELLQDELGVSPLPETVAVAARAAAGSKPLGDDPWIDVGELIAQVAQAQQALELAAAELERVVAALSAASITST